MLYFTSMLYFTTALNFTNEIWKQVTQVTDALLYLEIAKVYVEFVTQHFGERELNLVLADVVRHAAKERSNPLLQEHLAECCLGVLRHNADFVRLVSLETFMPLVDLLQGASQVSFASIVGLFPYVPRRSPPGGQAGERTKGATLLAQQGTHDRTHKSSMFVGHTYTCLPSREHMTETEHIREHIGFHIS